MTSAISRIQALISNDLDPDTFRLMLIAAELSGELTLNNSILYNHNYHDLSHSLVNYPKLFKVYLEEGHGSSFISSLFEVIIKKKDHTLLKIFLETPHISECISRRNAEWWIFTFYSIIEMNTSKECWDIVLSVEKLVITSDMILTSMSRLNIDSLVIVLRHPKYSSLLYQIPDPVAWQDSLHNRLYGDRYITPFIKDHNIHVLPRAVKIKDVINEEKKNRVKSIIRFIFWISILHIRMREFRERYWLPGNKKSTELKKEFESLCEK